MTNPRLALASDPANVAVARAFVSAGLATLELGDTACQKAKLVTSELITLLVENRVAEDIAVRLMPEDLSVRVEVDRPLPTIPTDVARIIEALEGITVETEDGAWVISFPEGDRGARQDA